MKSKLLILLISVLFFSCSDDEDNTVTPLPTVVQNPITVNSSSQFSFKIDGNTFTATEGTAGFMAISLHSESSSGFPIEHSYYSALSSMLPNSPMLAIAKGYLYTNSGTPDSIAVLNFYSPGVYQYTALNGVAGVGIAFAPDSLSDWCTFYPPGDQTGSSFKIDEAKIDFDPLMQETIVKYKATFNCKLYDLNGNVKNLTDGVAVLKVFVNL